MSKISYDKEARIISLKINNKKSVDSEIGDNVVIDYDKDGNITNIDVMDISMSEFEKMKVYFGDLVRIKHKVGARVSA